MNKMKFMLFAVAAMAAASCVKETAPEGQDKPASEVNYVQMEFTVDTKTKTAIAEDGKTVLWNKGDKICVFDNSTSATAHNNEFAVCSGAGTPTAAISGLVPEDATEFYAYYPYHTNRELRNSRISAYVREDQKVTPGTFFSEVPMLAKADANGNFQFKNVCSHIKFTLAEELTDVVSITLIGNNYETISGHGWLVWNEGNPSRENKTPNYPYVNLKPASGSTMTPGDYYFSIYPVNFTNGFTIILTKNNGTQVAKKTTKPFDLSAGNIILPMKLVAAKDLKEYTNYYLDYINGKDITIGGYTINQTTHPDVTLLTGDDEYTIQTDGLYFITPSATNVSFKGTVNNYMLIGTETKDRSDVNLAANVGLKANGSMYMLANLNIAVDNNLVRGVPSSFGNIIINNCLLHDIASSSPLLMNSGTVTENAKINSITIEDSELGFGGNSESAVLNTGKAMSLTNFTLKNNVFYVTPGKSVNKFYLIKNSNVALTNAEIVNNTFDSVVSSASGTNPAVLMALNSISAFRFDYNLMVNNLSTNNAIKIIDKIPASGSCNCNYYYTITEKGCYIAAENLGTIDYAAPVALSTSPLNATWKPANGSFGAYTITPVNGEAPTVPVGAQRADMTALPEDANFADNGYANNDLGKL